MLAGGLVAALLTSLGASRARAPGLAPAPRPLPGRLRARPPSVGMSLVDACTTAFAHELECNPLRVNAVATGLTFLVGDGIAQCAEWRRARGQAWSPSPARLARAFLTGLAVLGPLAHFYYAWMNSIDMGVTARVALDNTAFLFLDNACYLLSMTLLGREGAGLDPADLGRLADEFLDELWAMQRAGWRFLPLVAALNYLFVPSADRVLFMDVVDVVYATVLSLIMNGGSPHGAPKPRGGAVPVLEPIALQAPPMAGIPQAAPVLPAAPVPAMSVAHSMRSALGAPHAPAVPPIGDLPSFAPLPAPAESGLAARSALFSAAPDGDDASAGWLP